MRRLLEVCVAVMAGFVTMMTAYLLLTITVVGMSDCRVSEQTLNAMAIALLLGFTAAAEGRHLCGLFWGYNRE